MHTRFKNYLFLEELYRQAEEGEVDTILKDIIANFLDYPDVEDLITNKELTSNLLDSVYLAVTSTDIRREHEVLALLKNNLPYLAYLSDIGRYVLKLAGEDYLNSLPIEKKLLFLDLDKVVSDYAL